MTTLRKFLSHAFEVLAVIFALGTAGIAASLVRALWLGGPGPHLHHSARYSGAEWALLGALAVVFTIFNLSMPLVVDVCCGMAAWTIRRGSPSARRWAIAASIALLVQSVPLGAAAFLAIHSPMDHVRGVVILTALLVILGAAGLAAFCPHDSAEFAMRKKPQRIPGDCTSRWANAAAWIVAMAGYFMVFTCLDRWAHRQGLRASAGLDFWVELLAALLASIAMHEAGHAIAGIMLGRKLRMFAVGPFQWCMRDGRWRFTFDLKKSLGGATGCVPAKLDLSISHEICTIAAGPAASLTASLTATALLLGCKGAWYEPAWNFLATLAAMALVDALVNLLPLQPGALYSDGARIYQLIKGGSWADLYRVETTVASTLATPLRPRDWDLQAIRKAQESFREGRQAMFLRLWESSYFLDRGDFGEARKAFAEAEALYPSAEYTLNTGMLASFVYRSAFLSRDPRAARNWWDKLEAATTVHKGFSYWLAMSALRWVEGSLHEARSLLSEAATAGLGLPAVGDTEFDRYRCELLRREIEVSEQSQKVQTAPQSGWTHTVPERLPLYAGGD